VTAKPSTPAYWPLAWTVLGVGLLARLLIAADYPLVPDEAYYWRWSRELASGYFDHPPVIAWVIALGTALLGDTPIGVRLVPNLLGTVTAGALVLAARHLAGPKAAFHAALLITLLPLAAAGYILATPDAPLLAGISVTWWAVLRATDDASHPSARNAWWALAGLAIGLAMASKFTGVLVPAALAISCALIPRYRELFRTPGPYLAVAVASLVMAPVLWWNAQHQWITFAFQLDHGLGTPPDSSAAATLTRVAELLGGQLGLTGIIAGGLMVAATLRALRTEPDHALRLLARSSLLIFAFFVFSAIQKPVEANWPAVAYPSLVLVAAAAISRGFAPQATRAAHALSGALTLAIYAYALGIIPPVDVRPGRDPFNRAYGWNVLAAAVDERRLEINNVFQGFFRQTGGTPPTVHIAANRYQDASELSFYLLGRPDVPALNIASRPNHFDYWPGFAQTARQGDALILVLDTADRALVVVDSLVPHFNDVADLGVVTLTRGERALSARRLWLFSDWRGSWLPRQLPQQ
jgi:hypothetical protein